MRTASLILVCVPVNVCKCCSATATRLPPVWWLALGSACAQAELMTVIKPRVNFQGIQRSLQEFSLLRAVLRSWPGCAVLGFLRHTLPLKYGLRVAALGRVVVGWAVIVKVKGRNFYSARNRRVIHAVSGFGDHCEVPRLQCPQVLQLTGGCRQCCCAGGPAAVAAAGCL